MIRYQVGPHLKILFIGINPHPGSYSRGVPFSNNKLFWYLLHDAGLLDESREQLKDDRLLKNLFMHAFKEKYKFGFLNVVNNPTRTAAEVKSPDAVPGRVRIFNAITRYKPRIVCFVGKMAYKLFSNQKTCSYGWQPDIAHSQIYVMHAPNHGLARTRIKELKEVANR